MAQGKPHPKFERNPCIKFRDNCDTDGRRTDGQQTMDKLRFHELCWHSQAELKMKENSYVSRTVNKIQTTSHIIWKNAGMKRYVVLQEKPEKTTWSRKRSLDPIQWYLW